MLCLIATKGFSQKNLSEQVNVVRAYKPILAEALKINTNPEIKTETFKIEPLQYEVKPFKIDSTLKTTPIVAEKMKNESISKLYPAYIRIGGGNYASSFAEAYVSNLRSKEFQIGAKLNHQAAVGSVKNMDFSENKLGVWAKRIYSKNTFSVALNYDRDVNYFYGYDHKLFEFGRRKVRQQFDYIDLQSTIYNNAGSSNKLSYKGVFNAYNVGDAYKASESRLIFGASFLYDVYGLSISFDAAKNSDSLSSSNNLFEFSPSVNLKQGDILLTIGLNTYQEFGAKSLFHAYPNIKASYDWKDANLIAYAGITGKVRKNSFRDFYSENPFLGANQLIENSNEKMELFAGVRGSISNKTAYQFNFSFLQTAKEAYFVADSDVVHSYRIIYDGNASSSIHLLAALTYQSNDKVRLFGQLKINSYTTDTLAEAWHKPLYEIKAGATYAIADKFNLNGDVIAYSSMKAPNYPTKVVSTLKGGIDLSLGVDYRYSKIISVFTKFNNILSYKRERFQYYNGYGFQALVGVGFNF